MITLLALTPIQITGGIILLLAALALIFIIVGQSGRDAGLGAIDGGADSFLGKNSARSVNDKLKNITKWVAIVFIVVIVALNILSRFGL